MITTQPSPIAISAKPTCFDTTELEKEFGFLSKSPSQKLIGKILVNIGILIAVLQTEETAYSGNEKSKFTRFSA